VIWISSLPSEILRVLGIKGRQMNGGGESMCYIGNMVISYHFMSPSLSETEIEKWSSPDSGRRGGGGMRKERVSQLGNE